MQRTKESADQRTARAKETLRRQRIRQQLPGALARRMEGQGHTLLRTGFMKFACLAQEVYGLPTGYSFSMYVYGPQSTEAGRDLVFAEQRKEVATLYREDMGDYQVLPGEMNRPKLDPEMTRRVERMADTFGAMTPGDLDLAATTAFLWNRANGAEGTKTGQVISTVLEMKTRTTREATGAILREVLAAKNEEPMRQNRLCTTNS